MNYAKIDDGVCTNSIVADAEFAEQYGYIPLPEGYGIGDFYDGEKWEKKKAPDPPDPPEPEENPSDDRQAVEQEITDLMLADMEQGQFATALQLQLMEVTQRV